jgi:long-chain acyl-CoA synthetase
MRTNSIPGAFQIAVDAFPNVLAVRQPDKSFSFSEIDRLSTAVAAGLREQGASKGICIGLYCINGPEFVIAYLGILKTGATVVPLNLLLSPAEVGYILQDAGVSMLIYHQSMSDKVQAARQGLSGLKHRSQAGGQPDAGGDISWDELLTMDASAPQLQLDPHADVAAILYTSGTTGHPKGAQLTHANLLANTVSVRQALELQPKRDVILVVLPMFHSFAATVGVLTPLLHGLSIAPVPRFEPALVVEHIEACGATVFLGVPSMYALFLKLSDEQIKRWQSICFAVSGGAAMPVAMLEAFEERFGIPLLEGDGPTECGPVTCVNPLQGKRKSGSVGLPVPDVEMRILDEQGGELEDGEIGEVCVRSPSVMKGYLNQPDANAESFFGDWFRTGDLGCRDEDGYFFLIDRKKDMIIVNGMNVYPRMVEEALYRHPAVVEVAVVGEPHPVHGEIPIAHLVLKQGEVVSAGEIRAWCRNEMGSHELPRRINIHDSLPKNASGKILKRELRKQGEFERGVV